MAQLSATRNGRSLSVPTTEDHVATRVVGATLSELEAVRSLFAGGSARGGELPAVRAPTTAVERRPPSAGLRPGTEGPGPV